VNLPTAPAQYSQRDQQDMRRELQRADAENVKRLRDVRLENGERLILKSPNGTLYRLTVDNAGALGTAAI
jgi:hypothetical protein